MEVAFDSNGYPYDTSTGQLVNITYDDQGNAYDATTNTLIDTVIAPDLSTVYKVGSAPGQTTWAQVVQNVTAQLLTPPAVGYYPRGYNYPTYPTYAKPNPGYTTGVGGSISISPTTALLIGIGFVFFFVGKGKRG